MSVYDSVMCLGGGGGEDFYVAIAVDHVNSTWIINVPNFPKWYRSGTIK